MLVAVVIDVKNRVALGFDGNVLIELFQMEAGILVAYPLIACLVAHLGISVIARAPLLYSINNAAYVSGSRYRLNKIVAVASKILLPDDDGVSSCCLRNPARIDCRLVGQGLIEVVLSSTTGLIGNRFVCEPAAEGVAVADHGAVKRPRWLFFGVNELGGVVGCALAVLVEDEPMAHRSVNAKRDIARDCNNVVVLISVPLCIVNDIGFTFANFPSFKVIVLILNGISHIHCVALLV